MRLIDKIGGWAVSIASKVLPVLYLGAKKYNQVREATTHYVAHIKWVKKLKKKLQKETQAIQNAEDLREFTAGSTELVTYQLSAYAQQNQAKLNVLKHSLIVNGTLAAKAITYFAFIRPALYLAYDDYKIQALDYLITLKLGSEAASVAVENIGHIVAINKICSSEQNPNLYPPCKDHSVVRTIKANSASLVYYLGNKAFLGGVSMVPWVGPWVSRAGALFVEGQALAEFRLTNQCTEHRYQILRTNSAYSFGAGAVVVGSAYLINQGIYAITGVNSRIVELAVTNVTMLFNMLAIYHRQNVFPGTQTYPEMMYIPRKLTAVLMKETCDYVYRGVSSHLTITDEKVSEELYKKLGDVTSELASFILGKRFSSLDSLMQNTSFQFVIKLHESEIKSALDNIKWVQNTPSIQFSLAWLDYLPAFCFPEKLSAQAAQKIGQIFYANFARQVVRSLDANFIVEKVAQPETADSDDEEHFALRETAVALERHFVPFGNNGTVLSVAEPEDKVVTLAKRDQQSFGKNIHMMFGTGQESAGAGSNVSAASVSVGLKKK